MITVPVSGNIATGSNLPDFYSIALSSPPTCPSVVSTWGSGHRNINFKQTLENLAL